MAKASWWSCFLVALFTPGAALAQQAEVSNEELSIPSFKANQAAIDQYWQLLQLDIVRPRFVGLPVSEVVNKIVVDVRGPYSTASEDYAAAARIASARLDGYALRVMQSRLQELGVGGMVQVAFFDSMWFKRPPSGEECTTLTIEFVFNLSDQKVGEQRVVALMGDMIASLKRTRPDGAGGRRCDTIEAPWVMRGGPLLSLASEMDIAAVELAAQAQILRLVDYEIMPQIVNGLPVANATFRSWRKTGN
jgi:hypothetical protein